MEAIYCVFRVSGKTSTFLAACSTRAAAEQFCRDNNVLTEKNEPIYETRDVAALKTTMGSYRTTVVEKVALIMEKSPPSYPSSYYPSSCKVPTLSEYLEK